MITAITQSGVIDVEVASELVFFDVDIDTFDRAATARQAEIASSIGGSSFSLSAPRQLSRLKLSAALRSSPESRPMSVVTAILRGSALELEVADIGNQLIGA